MVKFNKGRIVFGIILMPVIAFGIIVSHALHIPAWPAFIIMIFFFLGHMDKKLIPSIVVGSAFGILLIIPFGIMIKVFGPVYGKLSVILFFTMMLVFIIIAFGEMVPTLINNYAFTTMLITGVEMTYVVKVHPFKLVAIGVIGGLFFIGSILGIIRMLTVLAMKKNLT